MMDGDALVVDASVVVKWYVPERDHESARAVRDGYLDGRYDLLAPAHLPFEVVNALRYADVFGDDQLEAAAESLFQYGIEFVPFDGTGPVVGVSTDLDVTVSDAAYLALASSREIPVFTADERLLEAAAGSEHGERVRHVRDAGERA